MVAQPDTAQLLQPLMITIERTRQNNVSLLSSLLYGVIH